MIGFSRPLLPCVFLFLSIFVFYPPGSASPMEMGGTSGTRDLPETFTIATFNTRNLGTRADDARIGRLATFLATYHLIVLEELRDTPVLDRLVRELEEASRRDFEAVVSVRVGSRTHGEYYGFIYDANRVAPTEFSGIYDDEYDSFARDPGYQGFRVGTFDFIVVAVHITWGSTVRGRQAEIRALAEVMRDIERTHEEKVGRPERDLILLGDFNRPQSDARAFGNLRDAGYRPAIEGDRPTTIGDVASYDNIWIRPEHVVGFTGESGVDEFDERLGVSRSTANRLYSDHRPIWAVFRVTERDDD